MAILPRRSVLASVRPARKLNPFVGGIISMTIVVPPMASAECKPSWLPPGYRQLSLPLRYAYADPQHRGEHRGRLRRWSFSLLGDLPEHPARQQSVHRERPHW